MRQLPKSRWTVGVIVENISDVMYNVLVKGRLLRVHCNQLRAVRAWPLPDDEDNVAEPTSAPRKAYSEAFPELSEEYL